jgi:hypothetical protein
MKERKPVRDRGRPGADTERLAEIRVSGVESEGLTKKPSVVLR